MREEANNKNESETALTLENFKNKTYYERLGLTKECTTDQIQTAYKKLALKYHPDKIKGSNGELFKLLKEAHSTLLDKRSQYNDYLEEIENTKNGYGIIKEDTTFEKYCESHHAKIANDLRPFMASVYSSEEEQTYKSKITQLNDTIKRYSNTDGMAELCKSAKKVLEEVEKEHKYYANENENASPSREHCERHSNILQGVDTLIRVPSDRKVLVRLINNSKNSYTLDIKRNWKGIATGVTMAVLGFAGIVVGTALLPVFGIGLPIKIPSWVLFAGGISVILSSVCVTSSGLFRTKYASKKNMTKTSITLFSEKVNEMISDTESVNLSLD